MNLRMPCNWCLEIGLISEVFRHPPNTRKVKIVQCVFDHKLNYAVNSPNESLKNVV